MGITVNTAVCVVGPGDNTALDPGTVKSPYPPATVVISCGRCVKWALI